MVKESQFAEDEFSNRDFRDALSSFATGVTIVTAQDGDSNPIGMTASSFNSVSVDPPLILWSVTKTALSASAFKDAKHFAVHVLATDQTDLSNCFAMSGTDKFGSIEYGFDPKGVPILKGCATRFDCSAWATYEGGDHWIIVGKVEGIDRAKKEGLVFGGGSYATAAPLATIEKKPSTEPGVEGVIDSMLFYHLSRAYHQLGHQFHQAVRDSGMTVAEWRVSASLYGQTTHSFQELMERTFLDAQSLKDIISIMEEDYFCVTSERKGVAYATGTIKGHDRVKHLFDLAHEQETMTLASIDGDMSSKITDALRQIVDNAARAP